MAVCADQERFQAAVDLYGDCDRTRSWAMGDRVGRIDLERNMALPLVGGAGYRAGSPITLVERLKAPLLILHGERDVRVHAQQSEELVEALKRLGKTFEYRTYPDEAHGFIRRANFVDAHRRIARFLDWYLMNLRAPED
jgi:dipeptidyl aminopeptidase/acylaminoacyl peptidase